MTTRAPSLVERRMEIRTHASNRDYARVLYLKGGGGVVELFDADNSILCTFYDAPDYAAFERGIRSAEAYVREVAREAE